MDDDWGWFGGTSIDGKPPIEPVSPALPSAPIASAGADAPGATGAHHFLCAAGSAADLEMAWNGQLNDHHVMFNLKSYEYTQ